LVAKLLGGKDWHQRKGSFALLLLLLLLQTDSFHHLLQQNRRLATRQHLLQLSIVSTQHGQHLLLRLQKGLVGSLEVPTHRRHETVAVVTDGLDLSHQSGNVLLCLQPQFSFAYDLGLELFCFLNLLLIDLPQLLQLVLLFKGQSTQAVPLPPELIPESDQVAVLFPHLLGPLG
jgi:hypothetical protein